MNDRDMRMYTENGEIVPINEWVNTFSAPQHIQHNITNRPRIPIKKDIRKIVGKGYKKIWDFRGRYLVVKGSRGSKKSTTIALRMIYNIMKYPESNAVVFRQVKDVVKDSVRAQLVWAIHQLGVEKYWEIPKSNLTLTYKPTGQQILFRGLDDPLKVTSITVAHGHLCWVWFEEAFEITNEDHFNKVDMSIRGILPEHLWHQIILTFNPWSDKHWMKERFFDKVEEDGYSLDGTTYATTTTYRINEFLAESDYAIFEKMKIEQPRRFDIEGNGNWGISEGLVYENWHIMDFDYKRVIRNSVDLHGRTHMQLRFGIDFGFTNDQTAFFASIVDEKNFKIYVFDEWYMLGQTNKMIAQQLHYMGYSKETIIADSSEPKSISELKSYGIRRIKGAKKGPDSVRAGILTIQDYEIIVHPKCKNFIVELQNYIWDTDNKTGKVLNNPVDDYNHLMDAMRYALEGIRGKTFRW